MRLPRLAAAILLGASCLPLGALTLKIATLAPDGSPWVEELRQAAWSWERVSGGRVRLKIYAGGVAGEEQDMVRKLRIGQLQGAALTQLGLGLIEPDVLAISIPFLVRDENELNRLLEAGRERYAGLFAAKGYLLAALPKAGWVHFFARQPVVRPDDLRRLKLAVPGDDPQFVEVWRRLGFNAFSLSLNDLLAGLQSGMADACYSPLLAAASFQWFGAVRYMPSLAVSPVLGGVLFSQGALEEVPAGLRPALLEAFRELETRLNARMQTLEQEALAAMRRHGLIVVPVPAEAAAQWRALGSGGSDLVIGRAFSRESYDWVRDTLEAYRHYR
jgi:TRAP-type C4-dicarboxylate transport system substrate-binding protein